MTRHQQRQQTGECKIERRQTGGCALLMSQRVPRSCPRPGIEKLFAHPAASGKGTHRNKRGDMSKLAAMRSYTLEQVSAYARPTYGAAHVSLSLTALRAPMCGRIAD